MRNLLTKLFSKNSARESDRVPEGGGTPRASDTLLSVTGGPDPDVHREAAADATADSEAGGEGRVGGGITPLRHRQ